MYAVVIVDRDKKKRVTYNSGKIYLKEKSSVRIFLEESEERGLEAHEIRLKSPLYEPGSEKQEGYFCPYCGNWEYWETREDAKHCPVCGMSDHDYYVKKANNLWHSRMSSKKSQRQRTRTRRKK